MIFSPENLPNLVELLNSTYQETFKQNQAELDHAKKELKTTEEKLQNMIKAISDGLYNSTMKTAMAGLEQQKELLLATINKHEKKSGLKITEQIIRQQIGKDHEEIRSEDLGVKKNILPKLI